MEWIKKSPILGDPAGFWTSLGAIALAMLFAGCAGMRKPISCGLQKACAFPDCSTEICNIYGVNENPFPITMGLDVKSKNMVGYRNDDSIYVLAPKEKRVLKTMRPRYLATGFSLGVAATWAEGSYKAVPDSNSVYSLPYGKGRRYRVSQGYHGKETHQGTWIYSLDFNMPEGDTVRAAMDGIVAMIVDSNSRGCFDTTCTRYSNYVSVLHRDGTFGNYAHLKQRGVMVAVGDTVAKGRAIGLSGATGRVTGPHLHFMVVRCKNAREYETMPIRFQTREGTFRGLKEGFEFTAK